MKEQKGTGKGHRAGINASFASLREISREEKAGKGLDWDKNLCPFTHSEYSKGLPRDAPQLLPGKVTNSAS